MSLFSSTDDELGDNERVEGRAGAVRPERFHRRKSAPRAKVRARRSRSNEVAKRGMHQRRNKRLSW